MRSGNRRYAVSPAYSSVKSLIRKRAHTDILAKQRHGADARDIDIHGFDSQVTTRYLR